MTSAPHAFTIVNHRGSSQPKMAFFYLRVVASSANLRDFYGLIPHGRAVHRSYGNTSTFERDNYDCIIYWLYIYIIIYIYIFVYCIYVHIISWYLLQTKDPEGIFKVQTRYMLPWRSGLVKHRILICNVGSKPESCHDQNSFSVLRNTGRQWCPQQDTFLSIFTDTLNDLNETSLDSQTSSVSFRTDSGKSATVTCRKGRSFLHSPT